MAPHRDRLLQLADAYNVSLDIIQPPLPTRGDSPTFLRADDPAQARNIVLQRRLTDPEYKKPSGLFKSKPKEDKFEYKEVNRALKSVVEENGAAGIAEALLGMGGDVNVFRRRSSNSWKKLIDKDQQDQESPLLAIAANNGQAELVTLFASRAKQTILDTALPLAVRNLDKEITLLLLERGADPTGCHDEFKLALQSNAEDLVELMLRAPKRPSLDWQTVGLMTAVTNGSFRCTSALLQNHADADFQQATAFHEAIKKIRMDLAIAIVASPKPPSPSSLDSAVALAYSLPNASPDQKFALVEVCLSGGACGNNAAATLVAAVETNQIALVVLLLDHGVSVDYRDGAALQHAVRTQNVPLLSQLLQGGPAASTLATVLSVTMTSILANMKFALEILDPILSAGAGAEALAKTLIAVVQESCMPNLEHELARSNPDAYELIKLLVGRGCADLNYQNGQALQIVASAPYVDVLRLMLDRLPEPYSLNAAFMSAASMQNEHPQKLQVYDMLLQSGACGTAVDETLVHAVRGGGETVQLTTLLLARASVDFNQGQAICEALQRCQTQQFDLLLHAGPSPATLNHVWEEAIGLHEPHFQHHVLSGLLQYNVTAAPLDRALVAAISKGQMWLSVSDLLLQHGASVDYLNGGPLVAAVKHHNLKDSVLSAWLEAWSLQGEERLQVADLILHQGLEQNTLDVALLKAVEEDPYDPQLVQLLVKNKATTDYRAALSLTRAAERYDLELLQMLAAAVTKDSHFSNALAAIVNGGDEWLIPQHLPVARFLLEQGARGETVDKATISASKSFNLDALQLFGPYITSAEALDTAFDAAVKNNDKWHSDEGLPVINYLLANGAAGRMLHDGLIQAARLLSRDAVILLAEVVDDSEIYTIAFNEVINEGSLWLSDENLDIVQLLLERGARGELLHMALLSALDSYAAGTASETLIDVLLNYGADVNYDEGQAIQFAAQHGDVKLLQKLFESKFSPTVDNKSRGLQSALLAQHEDSKFIAILDAFMNTGNSKPNLNFHAPDMDPLIILALNCYPKSPNVIQHLHRYGCSVMSPVNCEVYDDESLEPESVPALLWALLQPKDAISDSVVSTLIDLDVNFTTSVSKTTPLILATKYGKHEAVAQMLKNGAKASPKDRFDRSALFYAARDGDNKAMQSILRHKPGVNDGSMHEAARELHSSAVRMLVKAGHDPDFTSTKHGGRTALGETCLLCDGARDPYALEQTLDALLGGKANPLKKCGDRTPMFLALDNLNPVPVVNKLMERTMWRYINDERNVFCEGDYCYSPTMYITRGVLRGPESEGSTLLQLLKGHSAEDRYYARKGLIQPDDAVGFPDDIARSEEKKRARLEKIQQEEEDHQRREAVAWQEHERKLWQKEQETEQRQRHRLEEHQQTMQVRAADQHQTMQIRAANHQQAMQIRGEDHQQSFHIRSADHKQVLSHKLQDMEHKNFILQKTRTLEMDIQWRQEQQKQRVLQQQREDELVNKRRNHQLMLSKMDQEQRLKLQNTRQSDRQKLQTQMQQNQIRAAQERQQLRIDSAKNRQNIGYQQALSRNQQHKHKMQMMEMATRRQNLQLDLMNKHLSNQQRQLTGKGNAAINARRGGNTHNAKRITPFDAKRVGNAPIHSRRLITAS